MPLEFALRPRLTLERPAPRRWPRALRLPPVALPIAGYWLAMAAATYGLLQVTAQDGSETELVSSSIPEAATTETSDTAEPPAPPDPASSPPVAAAPVAAAPVVAPPADPGPAPEPARHARTFPESSPKRPALAPGPTPVARPPLPPAERKLARAPEPASPPWTPPALVEDRAQRHSEHPQPRANPVPAEEESRAGSLPSCESAAAQANQSIDMAGSRGAPDLTREAFASVLDNGSYLAGCAVPSRTALEICAAVQNGKVIGVSVATEPRSAAVNSCVRRKVAGLRFPRSERIDVTRTRFAPTR